MTHYSNDDPKGRQQLINLVAKNPSQNVIEEFLKEYPDAVHNNPIAFFTACERNAIHSALVPMMNQLVKKQTHNDVCPCPWILSNHIPFDAAKVLIAYHPNVVLKKSPFLAGYNMLDYLLVSDKMVKKRIFDPTLWKKLKLILMAAQYCTGEWVMSPIHMFLNRIMIHEEVFTNPMKANHILFLLGQLQRTDSWVFEKQNKDGKNPLHFLISQTCEIPTAGFPLWVTREIIRVLIEAYPESAKQFLNSTPPLHLAVANRWPCHDLLLAEHPEALEIQDPATALYPFQTAAMATIPDVKEQRKSATAIVESGTTELMDVSGTEEEGQIEDEVTETETAGYGTDTSARYGVDVTYYLLRLNPTLAVTYL